jgi:hypothetical protein
MPLLKDSSSFSEINPTPPGSYTYWGPEERAEISLGCRAIAALGRRLARTKNLGGHWFAIIGLAAATLATATLSFGAMYLRGALTLDRLIVATWPPLVVLATLGFAWQATAYLLAAERLLLDLSASPGDQQLIKNWRNCFTVRRQVFVASVLAVVGVCIIIWLSWRGGMRWLAAGLYASAIFISGFLGGLGFYVGAWSPKLSYSASRCKLTLNPFSPANSEELKTIASLYGRIVFGGVLVGILLCAPLLIIGLRYDVLRHRLWVLSVVAAAWIAVVWVFGVVHYHLHLVIMKTRQATRLTLRGLIEKAYNAITPESKEDSLNALSALIDLDERVRTSRQFAVNLLLILQALASVAAAALPLLVEFIKKKLEIGGGP